MQPRPAPTRWVYKGSTTEDKWPGDPQHPEAPGPQNNSCDNSVPPPRGEHRHSSTEHPGSHPARPTPALPSSTGGLQTRHCCIQNLPQSTALLPNGLLVSQQSLKTKYTVISWSFPRHPIKRTFLNALRQHLRASDRSFSLSRRLFLPVVQTHGLKTAGRTMKNATQPLRLWFHSRRLTPNPVRSSSPPRSCYRPPRRTSWRGPPGPDGHAAGRAACRSAPRAGSSRGPSPPPAAFQRPAPAPGSPPRSAPVPPRERLRAPGSPCPTCRLPPGAAGAAEQQPEVQRDPERTGAQQHQPVSHWPPPQPAPSPPRRDYGPARRSAAPPPRAAARPGRAELRCPAAAGSCSPAPAPAGGGGAGGGSGRLQSPECRGAARPREAGTGGAGARRESGVLSLGEVPGERGFASPCARARRDPAGSSRAPGCPGAPPAAGSELCLGRRVGAGQRGNSPRAPLLTATFIYAWYQNISGDARSLYNRAEGGLSAGTSLSWHRTLCVPHFCRLEKSSCDHPAGRRAGLSPRLGGGCSAAELRRGINRPPRRHSSGHPSAPSARLPVGVSSQCWALTACPPCLCVAPWKGERALS